MLLRVLVAWEGGPDGDEGVPRASSFAEMLGARLAVVSTEAGRGVEARRSLAARIRNLTGRVERLGAQVA